MFKALKIFFFKTFIAPRIIKRQDEWFSETRDWKKNDWRNWVAEEFERLKKSPWTTRNYPELAEVTFEDLVNLELGKPYKEAPEDFPAVMKVRSTGTLEPKVVKFSRKDLMKIILALGRNMRLLIGASRVKNAMIMGFPGLATGELGSAAGPIIAKRYTMVVASRWREYLDKLIKNKPFDFFVMVLPYFIDFFKHINVDIFDDISFCLVGGDILTDYARELAISKSREFRKAIYPVDAYGSTEAMSLAIEIPPNIVKSMQYIPETYIGVIKKENGEVVNLFDAKPGDRGEFFITPLFEYMVPHCKTGDIIEVVNDESMFGLPTIKVLGRVGQFVDMELKTLGRIKGIYSIYLRVGGITLDGFSYTNLLGRKFKTDHITLIKWKPDKVIMRTYVEERIKLEDVLREIKESEELSYLIEDIEHGVLELEIIHAPEVVNEVKEITYSRYGPQAVLPRMILLERED